ncbi:NADP-dependent isocitrate dehydrogenase [Aquimonas voraii]|uniref:Isocitrate dehydrogenase [NADP] n=1 Tax=Aquimonas voraii TaxID=265719 RepID=A0A1G6ZDG2_9GAMM|nr:NADP-dependent isocitrate dehydrogenase [Aquimonas voraii]SDD99776.1 isocitrate dehydrogenase [Aquimonas voraii]
MSALPRFEPSAAALNAPLTVAVAEGDGIGPEIMAATLDVLRAVDPSLNFQPLTVGLSAYQSGHAAGLGPEVFEAIDQHRVLLKGPITTPQGGGYKSVNVTLRKTLGLYANVRPCVSYAPFVRSLQPGMDVVIVRENEEDTYAGIEHRQTQEVVQCLKLITRPGCERIVRHAFEYARANGRRSVTCMSKDNIMKLTDGLFHQVFDEIAAEYPDIRSQHQIIDIGTARMASRPQDYDVVVTPNLYGDILSDVAAEVAGSIGLAPSANLGARAAMFEAVHGSAPDIAGRDIANPSGLILAAVMMLQHIGRSRAAEVLHNAWLRTLEDGVHTADLWQDGLSRERVGTRAFGRAVVARLGLEPVQLAPVRYPDAPAHRTEAPRTLSLVTETAAKRFDGVDVFMHWDVAGRAADALAQRAEPLAGEFKLSLITNRGVRVWPQGHPDTWCSDHWRLRFRGSDARAVPALLSRLIESGLEPVKTENLYSFGEQRGYSLAQGE